MSQAEGSDSGPRFPGYPGAFTFLVWGLPLTLISVWSWIEANEEGSAFFAICAAVTGAMGVTMTLIGSIGHGVRLGMWWADHDRQASIR